MQKGVVGERFVIQNAPLLNNHSKAKKSFKHFIKTTTYMCIFVDLPGVPGVKVPNPT